MDRRIRTDTSQRARSSGPGLVRECSSIVLCVALAACARASSPAGSPDLDAAAPTGRSESGIDARRDAERAPADSGSPGADPVALCELLVAQARGAAIDQLCARHAIADAMTVAACQSAHARCLERPPQDEIAALDADLVQLRSECEDGLAARIAECEPSAGQLAPCLRAALTQGRAGASCDQPGSADRTYSAEFLMGLLTGLSAEALAQVAQCGPAERCALAAGLPPSEQSMHDAGTAQPDGGAIERVPDDGGIGDGLSVSEIPRPVCPDRLPVVGRDCPDADLWCTYGNRPRSDCRLFYRCDLASGWFEHRLPCLAPPPNYCPAEPADEGTACDPRVYDGANAQNVPVCEYDGGTLCYCLWNGTWSCVEPPTEVGCPSVAPNAGEGCDEAGASCQYGTLCQTAGTLMRCRDGAWEIEAFSCPGR